MKPYTMYSTSPELSPSAQHNARYTYLPGLNNHHKLPAVLEALEQSLQGHIMDGGHEEEEKTTDVINSRLQLVMKGGKCMLGYKQTLKMIRHDKATLVILTNRSPALRKSEIEYYTPCQPEVVSIMTMAIILNWAQHVENTTDYVRWLSLIQGHFPTHSLYQLDSYVFSCDHSNFHMPTQPHSITTPMSGQRHGSLNAQYGGRGGRTSAITDSTNAEDADQHHLQRQEGSIGKNSLAQTETLTTTLFTVLLKFKPLATFRKDAPTALDAHTWLVPQQPELLKIDPLNNHSLDNYKLEKARGPGLGESLPTSFYFLLTGLSASHLSTPVRLQALQTPEHSLLMNCPTMCSLQYVHHQLSTGTWRKPLYGKRKG
ncbi:hypothetical protein GH733_001301 [Mirounga leonina]|nr:hypothetical protein GH733_001301 [Mirounga leonina]